MSLQDLLQELQERENERLAAKRNELVQRYPRLPEIIKGVAELTATPEDTLVRACVQTAWHYQDMQWHDILEIVRSFSVAKNSIEQSARTPTDA